MRLDLSGDPIVREGPYRSFAAAYMMSIPMRKDDNIAGPQLDRLSIQHFNDSPAFDD